MSYWIISDSLVRIKRHIVETVYTWNVRLSEAARKRETDKKSKDKNAQQTELQSPVTETKNIGDNVEEYEADSQSDGNSGESGTGVISKKIKSFDQTEGKTLHL